MQTIFNLVIALAVLCNSVSIILIALKKHKGVNNA